MGLEEHMVGEFSEAGEGKENEDYSLIDQDLGLVLLADSAGGHEGSEFAAEIVVDAAHKYLQEELSEYIGTRKMDNKVLCRHIFAQAVETAHNALLEKAEDIRADEKRNVDPMTTLEMALFMPMDDHYRVIWTKVGDSVQYRVSKENIVDVSEDKKSSISENWGIGINNHRPYTYVETLSDGERWVLCSDGISDVEGIADSIADTSQSPDEHARYVGIEAKRLGSKDDRTAVVVDPYFPNVEDVEIEGGDIEAFADNVGGCTGEVDQPDHQDGSINGNGAAYADENSEEFEENSADSLDEIEDRQGSTEIGFGDRGYNPQSAEEPDTKLENLDRLTEDTCGQEGDVMLPADGDDEMPGDIEDWFEDRVVEDECPDAENMYKTRSKRFPLIPTILFGFTVAAAGLSYMVFSGDEDAGAGNVAVQQYSGARVQDVPVVPSSGKIPVPEEKKKKQTSNAEISELEEKDTGLANVVRKEPAQESEPEVVTGQVPKNVAEAPLYIEGKRKPKESYMKGFRLYEAGYEGRFKRKRLEFEERVDHLNAAIRYFEEAPRFDRKRSVFFAGRAYYKMGQMYHDKGLDATEHWKKAIVSFDQYLGVFKAKPKKMPLGRQALKNLTQAEAALSQSEE